MVLIVETVSRRNCSKARTRRNARDWRRTNGAQKICSDRAFASIIPPSAISILDSPTLSFVCDREQRGSTHRCVSSATTHISESRRIRLTIVYWVRLRSTRICLTGRETGRGVSYGNKWWPTSTFELSDSGRSAQLLRV